MQRAGVREKKEARPNILFKSHFEGVSVLSAMGLVMDKSITVAQAWGRASVGGEQKAPNLHTPSSSS